MDETHYVPARPIRVPIEGALREPSALTHVGPRSLPHVDRLVEETPTGRFVTFQRVPFRALGVEKRVRVFVPKGAPGERFPVVYFQDGQNFGAWHFEDAMQRLDKVWGIRCIIVAVPAGETHEARVDQYAPDRDAARGLGGLGDAHIDGVANDLKPLIDRTLPTLSDAEHTVYLGSSMGGLSAMRAGMIYPHVFGRIGAMSPSLWWNKRSMVRTFARAGTRSLSRIYVDAGTNEDPSERGPDGRDSVVRDVEDVARKALELGYEPGANFGFREAVGREHNEAAWSDRLSSALDFLLADRPRKVDHVELLPYRGGLSVGERTTAALELVFDGGRRLSAPPGRFALKSDDPSVVRVEGDTLVAVGRGVTTVHSSFGGADARATVAVH